MFLDRQWIKGAITSFMHDTCQFCTFCCLALKVLLNFPAVSQEQSNPATKGKSPSPEESSCLPRGQDGRKMDGRWEDPPACGSLTPSALSHLTKTKTPPPLCLCLWWPEAAFPRAIIVLNEERKQNSE